MARILGAHLVIILALFCHIGFARDLEKLYQKETFRIGSVSLQAYVADTHPLRADGLMYISKLPENTGMLFVFEQEQVLSFWMKNTLIPLAIAFIDSKGMLVDIQEMSPTNSMVTADVPTYLSRKPATFALEMNKGWFSRHKIKVGDRLKLVSKARSPLLLRKLPGAIPSGH